MATTNTKVVSVTQLKTFIEAVEFAADSDVWIPSERQWKRIRDMIDRLEDTVLPPSQHQRDQPVQLMAVPVAPSVFDAAGRMTPAGGMPIPGLFTQGAPAMPIRTPDVDTSHGKPYTSSFA